MAAYNFDLAFQRNLLAAALADDKTLGNIRECVEPRWFTDEVLAGVAEAVVTFFDREHKVPDLPAIKEELKNAVRPGRTWIEYTDEASKVWKRRGTNPEYYIGRAVEFARRQAIAGAVVEAARLVNDGESSELDRVEAIVRRALQVGSGSAEKPLDYFGALDARVAAYQNPSGVLDGVPRVPSGIGPLDTATQGGLGPGEIGCIVGLPGHGKSTLLRQFGGYSATTGRDVLHVSLENSVQVTAQMYDSWMFGKPVEKIRRAPERFSEHMKKLVAGLKSRLSIQYQPTKSLTIQQLEVLIERADPRPRLVIVDYAALLRPKSGKDERRFELASLFEDLRGVSARTATPIWTAHQANRPGMGARLLGMEHLSECFEIAGIVDVGLSINVDESRPAECSLYVFKNRLGKNEFEVPCSVDWKISTIKAFSDEVEDD